MDSQKRQKYLNRYYANNAEKLRKMVDRLLLQFGWVTDHDQFYSLANEVFVQVLNEYDDKGGFDGFLKMCLSNKIKSEITRMNRKKRKADRDSVSLYTPINVDLEDEEDCYIEDILSNDINIEQDYLESTGYKYSQVMQGYLEQLSDLQREVLDLMAEGYKSSQIEERLNLTEREFEKAVEGLRAFENTRLLIRRNSVTNAHKKEGEDKKLDKNGFARATTFERTKDTAYGIDKIDEDMENQFLRDDHVLQRSSGQWNNLYKSEFISDILQGNSLTQIIVSEEVIGDKGQINWLIDGKQRCNAIREFLHDGFAISKNVSVYDIQYKTFKTDENGNTELSDTGFPVPEYHTFDIRGKKFSKLPKAMQHDFLHYQVPVMFNLNCDQQKIAYDISRFNRCRPMNRAQNGWTGMDANYAELVDNILRMKFFKPDCEMSSYTKQNAKTGSMRRMIVESVILSNFPDSFSRDPRSMCEKISEDGNDRMLDRFYANIERLSAVATSDTAEFFGIRDSFIWFSVFDKFTEFGLEDSRFIDFLKDFKESWHSKVINGSCYDEYVEDRSTKDKSRVLARFNKLIEIMKVYFHIDCGVNKDMTQWFISDATNVSEDEVAESMDLYEQTLDDLEDRYMPSNSSLRDEQNRLSLLALIAYMYDKDVELEDWFSDYVTRSGTYLHNQKQNYLHMLDDLNKFLERGVAHDEKAG